MEKTTFRGVFINDSVSNLHFMKVSTEIDNNFGYEKIRQLVDNIPLSTDMENCHNCSVYRRNERVLLKLQA